MVGVAISILSELAKDLDNLSDKDILRALDAAIANLKNSPECARWMPWPECDKVEGGAE